MNQQAHLVNDTVGPRQLAIVTPLFAFAMAIFSLRIYSRVYPKYNLDASDYTNAMAVLAEAITYALFVAAVSFGFGRHSAFVTPERGVKILQSLYGIQVIGQPVPSLARISIACSLLRIPASPIWKAVLWVLIGLQAAALIANEIFILCHCRPIRAMWETVLNAQCVSQNAVLTIGYVYIGRHHKWGSSENIY
ncbi:hypothetical protein DM02DRAFT_702769 [Periconia macrospinosa]|uniref:Rhodopsin domain-containing protein n=1 Tax=Periconia macrospinosa TaxID=97972 RepID=A0A2V1D2U5_9PLEO|nr:hypothetical protein DM02DRAFT_702769 [Periconia macrospinosa]